MDYFPSFFISNIKKLHLMHRSSENTPSHPILKQTTLIQNFLSLPRKIKHQNLNKSTLLQE